MARKVSKKVYNRSKKAKGSSMSMVKNAALGGLGGGFGGMVGKVAATHLLSLVAPYVIRAGLAAFGGGGSSVPSLTSLGFAGSGAYRIVKGKSKGKSIMPARMREPRMRGEGGSVVIARREYLGDILSGNLNGSYTSFNSQTFYVNPGLDLAQGGASGWLAPIGASFQQYRYRKLIFEFKSTSGNAISSTNSALGTVFMACQYDSSRPPYKNKQQMLDSLFAVEVKPSQSKYFAVEAKNSKEAYKLYDIRTGPLQSNQSQNTYDYVAFQIATQGMQAAQVNLGELWVDYEVCLEKTASNNIGGIIPCANYTWTNNISGQGTVPTHLLPLGDTTTRLVPSPNNQLPLTFIQAALGASQINLPDTIQQGLFLFELYWRGTSAASAAPPIFAASASGNCFLENVVVFSPNSAGQIPAYSTPTITTALLYASCYLGVTAGGNGNTQGAAYANGVTLTVSAVFPSSITDLQILVTQVNDNVVGNGL